MSLGLSEMQHLWTAFWNEDVHIDKRDPNYVFLEFPKGVDSYWGTEYSNAPYLLVRKEYEILWKKINEQSTNNKIRFTIEGTKGIGKTMFMIWLIYRIVEEAKEPTSSSSCSASSSSINAASTGNYEDKKTTILMGWNSSSKPSYFVFYLDSINAPKVKAYKDVTDVQQDFHSIDYYLSDEKITTEISVEYRAIAFFSVGNRDSSKVFQDVQTASRQDLYRTELMNIFTRGEILALAKKEGLSEHIGAFIYTVFGGSARMFAMFVNYFKRQEVFQEENFSMYKCLLKQFFHDSVFANDIMLMNYAATVITSLENRVKLSKAEKDVAQIGSLIFHYVSTTRLKTHKEIEDAALAGKMQDDDDGNEEQEEQEEGKMQETSIGTSNQVTVISWQKRFATTFMVYLASWIEEENTNTVIQELKTIVSGSGIGHAFEREVIKVFLTNINQDEFEITRLYPSKNVKDKAFGTDLFQYTKKVFIDTIDDISKLQHNELGVPTIPNFPLVDFILKPRIYFQATISKTHKGAVDRLTELNRKMMLVNGTKVADDPKMFFVLTQENYEKFRYVSDLPEIQQYKFLANFSAKARKRAFIPATATIPTGISKRTNKGKK